MSSKDIKERAIEIGTVEGLEYWVVPSPWDGREAPYRELAGFNGYVVFPKRPVRERGYDGILNYVPVHGGITYADEDRETGEMVYGFDTAHFNSETLPRRDPNWIKEQCRVMVRGIRKAAEVEDMYLRCVTNKGKAKHAQTVLNTEGGDEEPSFGALINIMTGQL